MRVGAFIPLSVVGTLVAASVAFAQEPGPAASTDAGSPGASGGGLVIEAWDGAAHPADAGAASSSGGGLVIEEWSPPDAGTAPSNSGGLSIEEFTPAETGSGDAG